MSLVAAVGCDSSVADGEAVYNIKCITCHGANGTGEAETSVPGAQDLATVVPSYATDAELEALIDSGTTDDGDGVSMLGVTMTDEEKANLIAYLRASFP